MALAAQHHRCAVGSGGSGGGKTQHKPHHCEGRGRRDNAVRGDEKNDSPFLIVVISEDAPGRDGPSLQPDAPFPVLAAIISGEKGRGRAWQLKQINFCASFLPLSECPGLGDV